MNFEDLLRVLICAFVLGYTVFCLVRSKDIKVVCKGPNKIGTYIIIAFLAACLLFKKIDRIGVISAAIVIIAGVVYSLVPSGYNEKGIYINGAFYPFDKITTMDFDYVNDYYQLAFTYKGKVRVLKGSNEDKSKLAAIKEFFENRKVRLKEYE